MSPCPFPTMITITPQAPPLFINPSAQAGYDTRSIFKQSLTGLNSEEPSLSYYTLIAGGRIIGFIPFPRVLVLCEMQSASSRI